MVIKHFPSTDDFVIRDCIIGEAPCKLVFPSKMDVDWNDQNKIFRSSIWTNDGELVSASYKKFTNLGESPEFEPLDENGELEFMHKLDGSAAIISKYRGEVVFRTRGTHDAKVLNNGDEVSFLKEKYPKLFNNGYLNSEQYSIICEWYSPKNIIVEKEANEPTLWLTGIVYHHDYSYLYQKDLDYLARDWNVERPKRYSFNTVSEMVDSVKEWKKGEGIVVYGNNGQILKKAKSLRYLYLHRIKSQLNSDKNLMEYYIDNDMPSCGDYFKLIEKEFDYEIADQLREEIQKVCNIGDKCKKFIDNILEVVHDIRKVESRKEQAEMIKRNYKENSSYVFSILDNKEINKQQWMKLMEKYYEN